MLWVFIGALILNLLFAFWVSRKQGAETSLDHEIKVADPKRLWLSYAASGLSVSGTVWVLAIVVDQYSYGALNVLFCFILGMLIFLGLGVARAKSDSFETLPTMLMGMGYHRLFSLASGLIYLMMMAWELYIGGTIISRIVFGVDELGHQLFIAGLISLAVLLYTVRGGMKSVLKTDLLQIVFCLGFIVLFGYNFFANFGEVHFAESVHRAWAPDYWNLMLAVLVADIATHWYSPVNLHYRRSAWASLTGAEEYKRAEITKLFARGTILMSAIWFVLLVFYIFSPIKPLYPNLLMGADAPWQQVLCLLAVLGALMSTLDSTLIACARQLRDALPKLDKKLGKYSEGLLLTLLNLFTAGLGIVMIIKTPNLFQMLMGTVGCLVFFFPGMLYAVLLKNRESLSRRRIAMSYVVFGAIVVLNLFELAVGINNFGWRIPLLAGLAGWLMLPPRAREFARATAI